MFAHGRWKGRLDAGKPPEATLAVRVGGWGRHWGGAAGRKRCDSKGVGGCGCWVRRGQSGGGGREDAEVRGLGAPKKGAAMSRDRAEGQRSEFSWVSECELDVWVSQQGRRFESSSGESLRDNGGAQGPAADLSSH